MARLEIHLDLDPEQMRRVMEHYKAEGLELEFDHWAAERLGTALVTLAGESIERDLKGIRDYVIHAVTWRSPAELDGFCDAFRVAIDRLVRSKVGKS